MDQLPFLVIHGAVVWKVLLVVLVVATLALGYAFRSFRARRAARAERSTLTATAPGPGPVVVRGRVREGRATTVSQYAASDDLSTSLVLDCDGERVELAGAIRVEQGTTVHATARRPKDLSPELPRHESTLVSSVNVDDEVIAVGTLAPALVPADTASYREATPRWMMTAAEGPIRVLATSPRVKPRPLTVAQLVASVIVAVPIWYGVLHVVGSRLLDHAADARLRLYDGRLPSFGSIEIAAAMPGSRDRALQELASQLQGFRSPKSERALQLLLALAELRGWCTAQILQENARLEPALAAARRCGTHEQVVALLAFLGRYDEAEHELTAANLSELATTIHIATGHWTEAARGADARAARFDGETPGEYRTREYLRSAAVTQRCLAALFRTYGGVAGAFAGISATATDRTCVILRAAAKPLADQAAAFAAIPQPTPDDQHPSSAGYDLAAYELQYAAGAPRDDYYSHGLDPLTFMFGLDRVWLAPFQLAAHPDDPRAHETMIAYHVLAGDLAAARAELAHVGAHSDRADFAIALALREGAPIELPAGHVAHPGLDEAIALRQGKVNEVVQRYMGPAEGSTFRADLDRAVHGDGDGLVAALHNEYLQWQAFAIPLLGVLPHLATHRDHALAALRMFRDDLMTFSTDHVPFWTLARLTLYRDIARLAGDPDDAAQWQAIIDRHIKMLGDRQKVTALVFWLD